MMNIITKIYPIALGYDQCYVLQSSGVIVIDAGAPGKGHVFERGLKKAGIPAGDVRLILITHGHWDHIGSAREIKELTGGAIAMHECEAHWLEEAKKPLSPGVSPWGRFFTKIMKKFLPLIHIPEADVDIRLGEEDFPLHDYGIPGTVIHTPGHSEGSLSVLLENGDVFVGDLAMNRLPLRFKPGLPIFAVDEVKVIASWDLLLKRGARTVYPAHGKPFAAEIMREAVERARVLAETG